MTDYTKLVEDLLDIKKTMFALGTSPINMDNVSIRLAYDKKWGRTANDAAAAIEALQAELIRIYKQLPKRGEWIWDDKRCIHVCSVCGSPKVRENMDRQIIKEQAYCYSCGAKMEVQE